MTLMMGPWQVEQAALFYEFALQKHVPPDHLLRSIDRFVELDEVRCELAGFYSHLRRPSIDPELMIRMLIVGYCFGIRSERRLCEEVHLNLAYRWFCRLGLDGQVPDRTFNSLRAGPMSAECLSLFGHGPRFPAAPSPFLVCLRRYPIERDSLRTPEPRTESPRQQRLR